MSSNIGVRFLSEFERGKSTAEIGKVITALQAVGLDLAVVRQQAVSSPNRLDTETKSAVISKLLSRIRAGIDRAKNDSSL